MIVFEYLGYLLVWGMYTEKGLEKRAARIKKCPYQDLLLKAAEARVNGISGFAVYRMIHQVQKDAGVRSQ